MPSNTPEYSSKYYADNKDHIKHIMQKRSKVKVMCDVCNKEITKGNMYQHHKTTKHRESMQSVRLPHINTSDALELQSKIESLTKLLMQKFPEMVSE